MGAPPRSMLEVIEPQSSGTSDVELKAPCVCAIGGGRSFGLLEHKKAIGKMTWYPLRSRRYHKAIEITEAEADVIIAMSGNSVTDVVVISQAEKWYDVREMMPGELEAFTADLERAKIAADDEEAQKALPN
jgi:hypothetical protein